MKTTGGYGLLLLLLIGSAFLILIVTKMYFTDSPSPIVSEEGAIESQEVTAIEAANKNIDTAKALQQKMNLQNQEINSALGE
jgi:hypothetical protein